MSVLVMIPGGAVVAYLGAETIRLIAARRATAGQQAESGRRRIADDPEKFLRGQRLDREPARTIARQATQAAVAAAATRRQALANRLREFTDLTVVRLILIAVMCAGWVTAAISQGKMDATIFQAVMNGNTGLAVLFTMLVVAALSVSPLLFKRVLQVAAAGTRQRVLGTIVLGAAFLMVASFMVQVGAATSQHGVPAGPHRVPPCSPRTKKGTGSTDLQAGLRFSPHRSMYRLGRGWHRGTRRDTAPQGLRRVEHRR